jgi:hypothetical protein
MRDETLPTQYAGAFMQLAFDALAASQVTIEQIKEELVDLSYELVNEDDTRESYLGRTSKILAESYLLRGVESGARIEALFNGVQGWNRITPTFIFTFPVGMGASTGSKFNRPSSLVHGRPQQAQFLSSPGGRRTGQAFLG